MLEVPLLVTEQNPDKLGKTVSELDICHAKTVVSKTRFSMLVPEIECEMKTLFENGKPTDVVLYGIEVRFIELWISKFNYFCFILLVTCLCRTNSY